MTELSLNILDIAMNSVAAGATLIGIYLTETDVSLEIRVEDNGCGMSPELVARVTDPFTTSRKTRRVGLGLPFFRLAAEQTGGTLTIDSHTADSGLPHGTVVTAVFDKTHIDFTSLGDVISTLITLIHGSDGYDLVFRHDCPDGQVRLDTRELREVLGTEVPLNSPEILTWIREYLTEQYKN